MLSLCGVFEPAKDMFILPDTNGLYCPASYFILRLRGRVSRNALNNWFVI